MPLDEYRKKRDFTATPEPAGHNTANRVRTLPIFVVQKHEASRLHYDFRLEVDGVLVSWAVPKGPSMATSERRLAIRTEDHPIEYAGFEGIIPEGHYGAGVVMVWDTGTYRVDGEGSAARQLSDGELKFTLNGQKLHGAFVLIRASGQRWFLIKRRDEDAMLSDAVNGDARCSKSGRSMEQIEAGASAPVASKRNARRRVR